MEFCMADNIKNYLDLVGASYLKDKIIECLKEYTDAKTSELILRYQSIHEFPNIGDESKLYISTSTNSLYRWDVTSIKYYCIGSDYNNIEVINGGSSS